MAYINVASWTSDQVTDWLKGLDDSMYNYIHSFTNNEVNGHKLLNIRPYELEQLGIFSIGHQEIVLEAVENLRNFHFNLDKENLQFLALQVASASQNLFRRLAHFCDKTKIETEILNDITRTIATIKPLVTWLERPPFKGQLQFNEIRKNLLKLGLEMATMAQRDRFVENPVDQINATAKKLAKLGDYIIQDITDPMLLQPAALNLVTLKKRESELGFNLIPSYHGINRVTEIKYNSPAHTSGKIEDGDEIIQINYQTVVGWQYKTVILHLRESTPDVLLTLKKRPKHMKIYGQIYMQPYRLPSKKRSVTTRWGENIPSPRANFLAVPDFNLPLKITKKNTNNSSDTDSSCSDDILTSIYSKSLGKEKRMYYPKPRAVLQRRNTICGDELSFFKNISLPFWHERNIPRIQNGNPSSPSLRDKSVSFGFGLEIIPRPSTCIGITGNVNSNNGHVAINNSLTELIREKDKSAQANGIGYVFRKDQNCSVIDCSKSGVCKVVRFDSNMKIDKYSPDNKYICNVENTILETFEPIPYADDEDESNQESKAFKLLLENNRIGNFFIKGNSTLLNRVISDVKSSSTSLERVKIESEKNQTGVNSLLNRRGRLDKSHSTPTYDNSEEESDRPPAVEPRKEFLQKTPPLPPPRHKKQVDLVTVPIPPPKPQNLVQLHNIGATEMQLTSAYKSAKVIEQPSAITACHQGQILYKQETSLLSTLPELTDFELPIRTKVLTLKKKNSLKAKRRKVNLKNIGTGDIRGHLYRRTKDKRGIIYWNKLYFILVETVLYGFLAKDSQKANFMIFLPGFIVSLAEEVHSKPFAFKVYHTTKTFYFAAESSIALNQWIQFIKSAALKENPQHCESKLNYNDLNLKDLYSETDSSGDESVLIKQICMSPPTSSSTHDMFNSQFKLRNTEISKPDSKYLSPFKKLTKSSLNFKNISNNANTTYLNEKKKYNEIPEPTEQFRTFRRKPGGNFGVQIATDICINSSIDNNYSPQAKILSQNYQTENLFSSKSLPEKLTSNVALFQDFANRQDGFNKTLSIPGTPKFSFKKQNQDYYYDKMKKLKNTSAFCNFHASNPNLIELDQFSKSLEMPKIGSCNAWDTHNNLQGFQGLTLKDLMLQKQEEEAQDMYNNRVFLGVEKKGKGQRNTSNRNRRNSILNKNENTEQANPLNKNPIQMRSLPKTPDYDMSFKLDDEDIKRTRTKEGLKLRDFGYELIPGDESILNNSKKIHSSNEYLNTKQNIASTLHKENNVCNFAIISSKKKYSLTHIAQNKNKFRGGSFSKHIVKFETFQTSQEKWFQLKHNEDLKNFKNNSPYSPMTIPLNKKSSRLYNMQIHNQHNKIKKSQTYNNEFKDIKGINDEKLCHRKNSAPMPILSKLQFSSNSKIIKEKKLLGSPRLHRAIFGRSSNRVEQDYDHEIFCPITFSKSSIPNKSILNASNTSLSSSSDIQTSTFSQMVYNQNTAMQSEESQLKTPEEQHFQTKQLKFNVKTPEYPNMECPPIFEPETYSLSDPNDSLTLLRRRNTLEEST